MKNSNLVISNRRFLRSPFFDCYHNEDVLYGTFTEEQLLEGKKQVFAGNLGEVVGPVETDLGPVIFRIRDIIPAKTTSFEEAKPELDKEYKLSEAIKLIDERIEDSQNLLAAGGTLEELNKEIGFSVENILFNSEANVPILENKIFFDTAQTAKVNDFPEIKELPNGGLFALRVDQIVDARQKDIDEIRTELTNAWQKQELQDKLNETAKDMLSKNQYKGEILTTNSCEVIDVCGAGDTFLSALAVHYCQFKNTRDAIRFANMCARVTVQKTGVYNVTLEDIK